MFGHCSQALREGRLDSAASRLGGVWEAVTVFHAGAMAVFGRLWRDGQRTMKDSGAAAGVYGGGGVECRGKGVKA